MALVGLAEGRQNVALERVASPPRASRSGQDRWRSLSRLARRKEVCEARQAGRSSNCEGRETVLSSQCAKRTVPASGRLRQIDGLATVRPFGTAASERRTAASSLAAGRRERHVACLWRCAPTRREAQDKRPARRSHSLGWPAKIRHAARSSRRRPLGGRSTGTRFKRHN